MAITRVDLRRIHLFETYRRRLLTSSPSLTYFQPISITDIVLGDMVVSYDSFQPCYQYVHTIERIKGCVSCCNDEFKPGILVRWAE
jgi:hypothetical protein